ncbi:hypothetical protein HPB52_009115 [Rhipicephalus sanguineus]|uniref:Uncharacterized protein n=1 Tax=Rhipicephalus sanguineus TaxID=34632 RepID=A0A9D4SQI5_RHISA|nr:hypothetical protein HPB52_009115 [Rhipicephalus sanguineus]
MRVGAPTLSQTSLSLHWGLILGSKRSNQLKTGAGDINSGSSHLFIAVDSIISIRRLVTAQPSCLTFPPRLQITNAASQGKRSMQ